MTLKTIDRFASNIRIGYFIAFLILLSTYILSAYTTKKLSDRSNLVDRTNQVIGNLNVLFITLKDDEAQFRGYLIVKDERFLNEYQSNYQTIYTLLNTLKNLTSDNKQQQLRLDALKGLINKRIAVMSDELITFRKNKEEITENIKIQIQNGSRLTKLINDLILQMKTTEISLLEDRKKNVDSFSNAVQLTNIGFLVVAVLLIGYSTLSFNKENRSKLKANEQSAAYRKQLEDKILELSKANRQLVELKNMEKLAATGRIARTIAHEVKNPVTNISLAKTHLNSGIPLSEEKKQNLWDIISRNCDRINHLVNDLMNSTAIAELKLRQANLNQLLDETLELAKDRIELKSISIKKNYATEICTIMADEEKIKIAFLNLIVNAIEAMEAVKGVLTITTRSEPDSCEVVIKDNGKGIAAKELINLFEPFYTTKKGGTGLGLTNTHNIILTHHANIVAESEPGKGTSFIVTFSHLTTSTNGKKSSNSALS